MGGFLVISKLFTAYINIIYTRIVKISHPSLNSPSRARTYNPSVNSRVLYH